MAVSLSVEIIFLETAMRVDRKFEDMHVQFVCTPSTCMTPKWLWTLEDHYVPHIHITTTPQSQISPRFALWPAVFEIQVILRQLHWMTPKWPWTLHVKVKGTPLARIRIPTTHTSQISLVLLSLFEIWDIWRQIHWMTPKWPWTYYKIKDHYRSFWGKCTEWPQNYFEHYKVKGVPCMLLSTAECQISPWFTVRLATSKMLTIFHFPIGPCNDKFQCHFLNLKFQNSNT